jgi:ketosteroid isomerase-like protein
MKLFKKIIVFSGIFCFGVLGNLQVLGQTWLEEEEGVWKIEEKYWEFWIKGNIEGLMTLIHKDFVGWPSSSKMPSDRKAAREFVEKFLAQTKLFAFEIKPAAIKIIGNVAVVHYFLILKDSEGSQVGSTYRITHTWMKQDGRWQLIGGMSAD